VQKNRYLVWIIGEIYNMGLKSEVASVLAVAQTDRDRMFRLIAICRDMEKIRLQVLVHVRKAVEMIPHIMPVNPECGLL
jgi:hypothetical protein